MPATTEVLLSTQTATPTPTPAPVAIADATGTSTPGHTPTGVSAFTPSSFAASTMNKLLASMSIIGTSGGNGYGILTGIVVSESSGLTVAVTAGTAMLGAPVQIGATTYVLPASQSTIGLWLKADGTLTHTLTLTPPSGSPLLIAVCSTSGSAITMIDVGGVVRIRDGIRLRTTGDIGAPADTPAADVRVWTQTRTGLYLWDGIRHQRLGDEGRTVVAISDSADTTLSYAAASVRHLELTGTLTAGRNLIVPLAKGYEWVIANGTGQTVTVKVAGGTGVTVGSNKTAIVRVGNTDVQRVTADV